MFSLISRRSGRLLWLASLVSISPLKAGEIQALLGPDTALLEYFLSREGQLVFVVTQEKVLAVSLQKSPEVLFELIRGFKKDVVEGISLEWSGTNDYLKAPLGPV